MRLSPDISEEAGTKVLASQLSLDCRAVRRWDDEIEF